MHSMNPVATRHTAGPMNPTQTETHNYRHTCCHLANATDSLCSVQFRLAVDRPTGLRGPAEVVLVPAGGDVRLGAADWALETAKITSACLTIDDEMRC